MAYLRVNDVTIDFPIYGPAALSLRARLLRSSVGGRINRNEHDVIITRALEDVSFCLNEGDRIALIGHNGAGKSTLLRVLAGVYAPTFGTVEREGTLRSLFDLALGMSADATGRENIIMRGLLNGATMKEIEGRMDEIIAFSELGDYIHMPLRIYSSGMRLRLAFSVATIFSADIVLLDEILGVGDESFFKKAQQRLKEFVGASGIVVLATHSRDMAQRTCDKALWLEHGKVKAFGPCSEVLDDYLSAIKG